MITGNERGNKSNSPSIFEKYLLLFFKNYFFEITIDTIKSKPLIQGLQNDPAYLFYMKNKSITKYEDIEKYKDSIYSECTHLSERFVAELKKNRTIRKLMGNSVSDFRETISKDEFEHAIHEVLLAMQKEVDVEGDF